ncbi:MAG: MurT ligase domain-containing protein [Solirubrobacteraceae bacterium MAG38_C4-C5]|nr:MurT ligase domain-containing protein [Candidatus Siliceabacter maunaloa]
MSPALGAKLAAARAAGALSRRAGRGGTSLPGKLLLRLEPRAIAQLAARLPRGNAVISATNGKTTTAAMVAAIMERTGARLVHNRAGANMAGGVAASLLGAAGQRGTIAGDLGLFEVDEFWLHRVTAQLRPRALLLANLFRDQLDRYGELETIAERWAGVVRAGGPRALVLNADDPLVADLGRERAVAEAAEGGPRGSSRADGETIFFGVEDVSVALAGLSHASDSKHCRRCGTPYVYDTVFLGHLGHYHCPNGDNRRPEPQVAATSVVLNGARSAQITLRTPAGTVEVALPLPGLYNVYNALGATALSLALGAGLEDVRAGLEAVSPAFGRAETVQVGGRPVSVLLVKNPAGANEVLRTLALEEGEHDLLAVLNDRTADGRDVSWVWDADFELLACRLRRATCSGTRAAELALRLKYAGVPTDRLHVVDDIAGGLDAAVAGGEGPLYVLPTYTALLELRRELVARGLAGSAFG